MITKKFAPTVYRYAGKIEAIYCNHARTTNNHIVNILFFHLGLDIRNTRLPIIIWIR